MYLVVLEQTLNSKYSSLKLKKIEFHGPVLSFDSSSSFIYKLELESTLKNQKFLLFRFDLCICLHHYGRNEWSYDSRTLVSDIKLYLQSYDCRTEKLFFVAHSTTEKQSFKNGDILTVTISPQYGHMTVVRINLFYNTSPGTCVIKLTKAVMNGHITVKYVSVL